MPKVTSSPQTHLVFPVISPTPGLEWSGKKGGKIFQSETEAENSSSPCKSSHLSSGDCSSRKLRSRLRQIPNLSSETRFFFIFYPLTTVLFLHLLFVSLIQIMFIVGCKSLLEMLSDLLYAPGTIKEYLHYQYVSVGLCSSSCEP